MFIPWWGVVLAVIALVYLLEETVRLHRRVARLEKIVWRLEGLGEDDIKREIRQKMYEDIDQRS
jgi:hypothetical protein